VIHKGGGIKEQEEKLHLKFLFRGGAGAGGSPADQRKRRLGVLRKKICSGKMVSMSLRVTSKRRGN